VQCPKCQKTLSAPPTALAGGPPPIRPSHRDNAAILDDPYAYALDRLRCGDNQLTIRRSLLDAGHSPSLVDDVVRRAIVFRADNQEYQQQEPSDAHHTKIGCALCLCGLAITIGTYLLSAHVGVYVVAWGPIVWGLVLMSRGGNASAENQ
jgi:hypothetical protein